jgi:hypothetical protein
MWPGRPRVFRLSLAFALAALACGEAPEREMQQAQGALDAARAAGANDYARDEFAAAEDALKRAQQAVADRDYRLALNDALDSRERAQAAAKQAADNKATARTDADRALASASAALNGALDTLRKAEGARVAPRALARPRQVIASGEQAVQEARAAFQQGNYLGLPDTLAGVTASLRTAAQELEAAATAVPVRRRR